MTSPADVAGREDICEASPDACGAAVAAVSGRVRGGRHGGPTGAGTTTLATTPPLRQPSGRPGPCPAPRPAPRQARHESKPRRSVESTEEECAAVASHAAFAVMGCHSKAKLTAPEEMAARLLHGVVETNCAHVDVRQPFHLALVAQLTAPPPGPGGGFAEFGRRCLPLVLGFWAAVGGKVCGGEGAVPEEACPDADSRQRSLQTRGV